MSHLIKPSSRQFYDRPRPNPKLPPRNTASNPQGDTHCSSPGCLNYNSSNCGFCQFHCLKYHNGLHYNISDEKRKVIDELIEKYLNSDEVEAIVAKYRDRNPITEADIELVAQQANVTKEQAKDALIRNNADLAKAIVELTTK